MVWGVLALALNLRAALAGYPPLIGSIQAELGVSAATAGLVQAGAVLMMAAGSFAGPWFGRTLGLERGLGTAVGIVAAGSLIRGVPALAPLVGGSLVVGLGIGVAGALLAGVVKARLAARVGAVTGAYVVAMMIGATISSALAVPLAVGLGGWSFSLAVWAVPAALAAGVWTARANPTPPGRAERLPWGDGFARLAACYQIGTSMVVYGWLTWLAPYYASHGLAPQQAGLLLAVWSIAHIPGALLVPALAERDRRWTLWSALMLGCTVVGTLGVLLAPLPPVVGPWPWVVLIGLGGGAGFPLGLTVIAWRSPDAASGAATSALAMGAGYTVAGFGPLLMGVLVDATGGYELAVALLLAASALQAIAIARIGVAAKPRSSNLVA